MEEEQQKSMSLKKLRKWSRILVIVSTVLEILSVAGIIVMIFIAWFGSISSASQKAAYAGFF